MIKLFNKRKEHGEQPIADTYYTILLDAFIENVIGQTIESDILEMFLYKLKDKQQMYEMKLTKQINVLNAQYTLVSLLIKRIRVKEQYNQLQKQSKESYGFDLGEIGITDEKEKEIWKVLTSIVPARNTDTIEILQARSKSLLSQKQIKERELEGLRIVSDGGKPSRDFFDQLIVFVGAHHKIQINRKQMLLSEFVHYYLLMKTENDILKSEKQKHHVQ